MLRLPYTLQCFQVWPDQATEVSMSKLTRKVLDGADAGHLTFSLDHTHKKSPA